jgi:iron complex transport system substrate-binding protein
MFFRHLRRSIPIAAIAALIGMFGCAPSRDDNAESRASADSSAHIRDDFGDTITAGRPFTRIVSLNPTTTELLFAIGAGALVVGRSHWDQWPAEVRRLPDLGPGIRPNLEVILAARPDLVLLYASGDNRLVAQRLRTAGVTTYASKVDAIDAFRQLVHTLGLLVGDTTRARTVVDSVDRTLAAVRERTSSLPHPTVLIPAWEAPLIVIGGGSHMSELVEIAGGRNVYADHPEPSPQVAFEDVVRRDPDIVLTGPEGRKRILASPQWRNLRAVREGRVFAYDTTVVGRPSVTMGAAATNLERLVQGNSTRPH